METGEFHWQDGWYFKRMPEGGVRMRKREASREDAPIVLEVIVDADSWCSIVSHVTAGGEAQSWPVVRALHRGM